MTINEAMRTYRLPNPTTAEDLETRWSKILNFGDKVLLAGYYYNGNSLLFEVKCPNGLLHFSVQPLVPFKWQESPHK